MSSYVTALKHILKYANLSDNAILVYSALVGLKPRTLGEIVNLTNLSHEDAERAVRELMVAKLVREIEGRPTRYEALPPYSLIKQLMNDLINSLQEFNSSLTQNIEQSMKVLSEGLQKFSDEISASFEKSIISLATSLETILTKTVVDGIVSAMEQILKSIISQTTETAKKQLESLKDNMINEFKKSLETSLSGLTTQINASTRGLTETIRSLLQEQTKEQINKILENFEISLKAIDALIMKGFEKETSRAYEIQIIKGLSRIQGQAGDIIKRTKNFVIIIAPNYDFVPVDLIMKLPRTVRVQIVAGVYPKHKDILETLKKRGIATQLREQKGLNVFGVVADMREALLSALPETVADPEKVLGIFTNDETWVAYIQSQLSHIFMGASRIR